MPKDTPPQHPERELIHRAINEGLHNLAVTTNPLALALNMHIVSARDGSVNITYTIDTRFTQGNGFVQGGIVSAMLDFAMIFAAFSKIPPDASLTTVSQTTNYFRPVRAGQLYAEAELEKAGRTLINARASLRDPAGSLLAGATAPLAIIKHAHT